MTGRDDKDGPLAPPEVADLLREIELRAGYILGTCKEGREMRLEAEEIKRLTQRAFMGMAAWWHASPSHALPKRCTCYVLPHADDCGLFMGITQSGARVYASETPRTDEFESRIVSGDETHAPLVKPLTNQIDYCAAYGEAIEEMGRMEIELADALAKAQAAETTPSATRQTDPEEGYDGWGELVKACREIHVRGATPQVIAEIVSALSAYDNAK